MLQAADFMIDEEAISTLSRLVARYLLGPDLPIEDSLQVRIHFELLYLCEQCPVSTSVAGL